MTGLSRPPAPSDRTLPTPASPEMPLVSVVIPTYNRAARLPAALQSVADAGLGPAEVVVVDDGSTDGTADVVRRFDPVRYIRQDNAGPAAARNRGIRAARGEYLLFLDSDDRLLPGVHRPLIDFLERRGDVGVVFTDCIVLAIDGTTDRAFRRNNLDHFWRLPHEMADGLRIFDKHAFLRALILDRCYLAVTSVIRKRALDEAGLFDERLLGYEEWDLFARLAARCAFAYVDEPAAVIAKHESNFSGDIEAMTIQGVAILDKFLNGAVPVTAEDRPATLNKLNGMMFGAAYFAMQRGDRVTARARLAAYMKRWGITSRALTYWCATWLPSRHMHRLREWKTRLSDNAVAGRP